MVERCDACRFVARFSPENWTNGDGAAAARAGGLLVGPDPPHFVFHGTRLERFACPCGARFVDGVTLHFTYPLGFKGRVDPYLAVRTIADADGRVLIPTPYHDRLLRDWIRLVYASTPTRCVRFACTTCKATVRHTDLSTDPNRLYASADPLFWETEKKPST